MKLEEFEKLTAEAIESLPDYFKQKLDNVQVVVEMWPSAEIAKGRLLLGLYQGIPKPKRGMSYTMVLPDKITVFMGPIELISKGDEQVMKNLVIDTVKHEIAHHFGISDARLREIQN
ncbi:hypothetical protein A3B51_02320 [Candidatus Curtissbacteria bacterium RIFCSPLOWO2_01_FULL_41_18]|uniref:Metallopeptidase family protein n=2 Tax=Candidatus Curtissiibacteriota TaxID=1752717 RepID=A0A1F5FY80_9BACT|nr:MAG: hypothetical protein A2696_02055 [Candidatus Curtissbacteria bacterium RIFCSPHIGHO2_01_FULL_41_13]OGE04399.1 MAG: hypothetical protein A3B51_02320 [Candidatus Curtissbacteria bacterium RIFCSPLOWO2_01_FULL_41_18]